jgi:hypothetical protein
VADIPKWAVNGDWFKRDKHGTDSRHFHPGASCPPTR